MKFAGFFVLIKVLPLYFEPTFVLAFDDFVQTSVVVALKILIDNNRVAFDVLTVDSSKITCDFVAFDIFSPKLYSATFFKQRLSSVRTLNDLKWAILLDMLIDIASFNLFSTIISALNWTLGALILDVFLHVCQRQH